MPAYFVFESSAVRLHEGREGIARAKKAASTRNRTEEMQEQQTQSKEVFTGTATRSGSDSPKTSPQVKTKKFFIDIATKLDKIELAINSSKNSLRLDGQSLMTQERKQTVREEPAHLCSVTSSIEDLPSPVSPSHREKNLLLVKEESHVASTIVEELKMEADLVMPEERKEQPPIKQVEEAKFITLNAVEYGVSEASIFTSEASVQPKITIPSTNSSIGRTINQISFNPQFPPLQTKSPRNQRKHQPRQMTPQHFRLNPPALTASFSLREVGLPLEPPRPSTPHFKREIRFGEEGENYSFGTNQPGRLSPSQFLSVKKVNPQSSPDFINHKEKQEAQIKPPRPPPSPDFSFQNKGGIISASIIKEGSSQQSVTKVPDLRKSLPKRISKPLPVATPKLLFNKSKEKPLNADLIEVQSARNSTTEEGSKKIEQIKKLEKTPQPPSYKPGQGNLRLAQKSRDLLNKTTRVFIPSGGFRPPPTLKSLSPANKTTIGSFTPKSLLNFSLPVSQPEQEEREVLNSPLQSLNSSMKQISDSSIKSSNPVIKMTSVYSSGQYQGKRKNQNWSESSQEQALKLEESSALSMKSFVLPQSLKNPSRVAQMFRVPLQRAQSAAPKKRSKLRIGDAPSDDLIYGIPQVQCRPMHVQSTLTFKTKSTSPNRSIKGQTDSTNSLNQNGARLQGGEESHSSSWVAITPSNLSSTFY